MDSLSPKLSSQQLEEIFETSACVQKHFYPKEMDVSKVPSLDKEEDEIEQEKQEKKHG